MGTVAGPFGFIPRFHPTGQNRANAYTIAANYNTAIGQGDAVILDTNGTITVGSATNDLLGTLAGVTYKDSTGKPVYTNNWPGAVTGATDIVAYVYDDPNTIYEAQLEAGGSSFVQTAVGAQTDLVAGTVNATTGRSTMALEATIEAGGAQGQFRVVGFGPDGIYDATNNTFPTVLVQIAQHQFVANKVGI